ncbi:MAG: sugar ABC transporter permease [bacterium]|nr:sugar ABC transporter permease [bacterium]
MYRHKYRLILPFLFPGLALYITFVVYPYGRSMYVAFTKWRGLMASPKFAGLANFDRMIHDKNFWNALGNNVTYLIFIPLCTIALSLFLAYMLSQGARFSQFYRVVFFFPQVMSVISIGVLWSYIYHPTMGMLTSILKFLGLEPLFQLLGFESIPVWMGDPTTAIYCIGAVVIWQSAGFYMVLFLAAMQGIPDSYYEAASLDGASHWKMFWKITLPLLWEPVRVATVYSGMAAFNMFALTRVMTNAQQGPNRSTDVLATYLYEQAFQSSRFGYATAIAVSLFVITLTLSLGFLYLTPREQLEYS